MQLVHGGAKVQRETSAFECRPQISHEENIQVIKLVVNRTTVK